MLKKTLLSAAIASSFALSGCLDDSPSTTENAGSVNNPAVIDGVYPVFSPATREFPIPNDLLYASETAKDGTFVDLGVPNPLPPYSASAYNPVTAAIGALSGASTSASIDIKMSGLIDATDINILKANVFVLKLDYNSRDPLQALSIGEPPTGTLFTDFEIEHKVLDNTSFIRINPTKPLEPLTRYIVVIKNGITDQNGDAIVQSPGAAGYSSLTKTDAEAPLTGSLASLAPVRALINGLWEGVPLAAGIATSDEEIALSYSFMTSGDEKVLNYIADPKQWFNDQITRFVGISAVKAMTGYVSFEADGVTVKEDYRPGGANHNAPLYGAAGGTGKPNHTTIGNLFTAAVFPAFPSADIQAALPTLFGGGAPCNGLTGAGAITCIASSLAAAPSNLGGFADLLPTPKAAEIDFTGATAETHPDYANVSVIQGSMKVPYYSRPPADLGTGAPAGTNAGAGAPIKYLSWEADDALATAINVAFAPLGLELPQADPSKTTAVNYVFPFPKQQDADVSTPSVVDKMTIPITVAYPTANAGGMKTMIIGHGLGGSRSIALDVGAPLIQAAPNFAVVAIDQPLHGMKADYVKGSTTLLTATDNERHFGYAEAGAGLPPRALEAGDNLSLLFVNVESFLTTRDNNRQNVLDHLALRKAIGGIDLAGMSGSGSDLNGGDVYYQGYSLGTISAQAMVAVANDTAQGDPTDDFKSAFFSTPGGGIARFFESSPAFAANIIDGLAGAGLTSSTADYQTFLHTIQASVDAFDAINFVGDYEGQGTKVLYYTASNDQVIPVSQVPGRTLSAPAGTLGSYEINASVSYLSGAEPLLIEANAAAIENAGTPTVVRNVIRFKPGAGSHGGPCPATKDSDLTLDGPTIFGSWALSMIDNDAPAGTVDDGDFVLGIPLVAQTDWIDAAPIEDFFIDPLQCAPASS